MTFKTILLRKMGMINNRKCNCNRNYIYGPFVFKMCIFLNHLGCSHAHTHSRFVQYAKAIKEFATVSDNLIKLITCRNQLIHSSWSIISMSVIAYPIIVISSTNRRCLRFSPLILIPCFCLVYSPTNGAKQAVDYVGDMVSPCRTPFFVFILLLPVCK